MFVVTVLAVAGEPDQEIVGPFPDAKWAQRWIDKCGYRFHECKIAMLLSPRLINPELNGYSFDPEAGIDQ
jgi:hypothetical protein